MAKPASGRAPAYTAAGVAGPPARELALPAGIHPGEPNGMGGPAAQGHSPVGAPWDGPRRRSLSRAGHVKPGPKQGGPPSKPEYSPVTDSAQVPRGKGEKHPGRGVKQYLKPCARKASEHPFRGVTACLL